MDKRRNYYDDFEFPSAVVNPVEGETNNPVEAIGSVMLEFAELEDRIGYSISFLLGNTDDVGQIVTAEMSFKQKLHVLASLFRSLRPDSEHVAHMHELVGKLARAEELRNQVVHSSWRREIEGEGIIRRKVTAKMGQGLKKQEQTLTALQILAIGYHLMYLDHCLDELLYMEFGSLYGEP